MSSIFIFYKMSWPRMILYGEIQFFPIKNQQRALATS